MSVWIMASRVRSYSIFNARTVRMTQAIALSKRSVFVDYRADQKSESRS